LTKKTGSGSGGGGSGLAAQDADLYDFPLNKRVEAPPGEATAYVAALRNAAVVLAPGGDDFETFRFWEALSAGAIPVTVAPPDVAVDFVRNASAFASAFAASGVAFASGAPLSGAAAAASPEQPLPEPPSVRFGTWGHPALCPVPVLSSWDQLPALLERLFDSGDGGAYADALQRTLHRCFAELVSDVQADIRQAVGGLFDEEGRAAAAQVATQAG
jgi:hypothetical protein